MTLAKHLSERQATRAAIPEQLKERLLHVPMVRLDYTVKDEPSKGKSLPKSVRVCDINHVRYLILHDVNIGERNALFIKLSGMRSVKPLIIHAYNPYLKGIVRLLPQRFFVEHMDDIFGPMMLAHPEWKNEFNRLVEVAGIAELPKGYQHVFEPYNVTDGEKAYYEIKQWRKDMRAKHGASTGNMMRKAKYRHGKEALPV